jgi:hypothetical protein
MASSNAPTFSPQWPLADPPRLDVLDAIDQIRGFSIVGFAG